MRYAHHSLVSTTLTSAQGAEEAARLESTEGFRKASFRPQPYATDPCTLITSSPKPTLISLARLLGPPGCAGLVAVGDERSANE